MKKSKAMTPADFAAKMQAIENQEDVSQDYEVTHSNADDLLCEMLIQLGYGDGVEIYKKLYKICS